MTGPHPGPAEVRLPAPIAAAILAHAHAEVPNEACGIVVGSAPAAEGGAALRYVACRNAAASPYRFTVHPDDLYRVSVEADDADEVFWGIVHSHLASPAEPSPSDVGLALYPDALYLVVSVAPGQADLGGAAPSLRAWRIVDGAVHEVALGADA